MLDELKSKLGFGNQPSYDDQYVDDYDEYAPEYDDYGADDQSYDRYDPAVTTRPSSMRSRRSSMYAADQASSTSYNSGYESRRSGSASSSHPRLVSIDDVKSTTRIPDSLNRDPLPPRRSSAPRGSALRASDYTQSGAETGSRTSSSYDSRHAALDSLFTNSTDETQAATGRPNPVTTTSTASTGYDPYKSYEGVGTAKHAPSRRVTVLAPTAYDEVEGVARSLKAGDAVVLNLHNTGNQLSKRVLDFSFGVASALDASVDCIADQVFAITRLNALTDSELTDLRTKGVL